MRIRVEFSKADAMQYVGHLDLHRAWERIFRRSGLPLQYSQGFHPQPRLNLACALPVGFTSQCELLDAWLEHEYPLSTIRERLVSALPPGLDILNVDHIDDRAPALQTQVDSTIYQITFLDELPDLDERVQKIINSEHLPRVRRDKPYDLRPLIDAANLLPRQANGLQIWQVQLAAREGATGRPEELLDELGVKFENTRVHRVKIILNTN
jgi:radical SAM-linked protein